MMEKYEKIRLLGEGSYGRVYLMRHKSKDQLMCLKYIRWKNMKPEERLACKTEVQLLERLRHPHVVGFEESFVHRNNQALCIVMTYCDGGDLSEQVKLMQQPRKTSDEDGVDEAHILQLFVQIALGLEFLHQNRVLHRDLKTQNIFLLSHGRVVIGDFGIAKVLDGSFDFASTCIGTPYYMSPEVFQNKPYNTKSDVWSLGCILYEMVTGKRPFQASNLAALAFKVTQGRYSGVPQSVSKPLRDLLTSMLRLQPKQRPDVGDILRLPILKKYVYHTYVDFRNRERVQNVAPSTYSLLLQTLTMQLNSLGLGTIVDKAEGHSLECNPSDATTPKDSMKLLRRHSRAALQYEQNRQKIVQGALGKLEKERKRPKLFIIQAQEAPLSTSTLVESQEEKKAKAAKAAPAAAAVAAVAAPVVVATHDDVRLLCQMQARKIAHQKIPTLAAPSQASSATISQSKSNKYEIIPACKLENRRKKRHDDPARKETHEKTAKKNEPLPVHPSSLGLQDETKAIVYPPPPLLDGVDIKRFSVQRRKPSLTLNVIDDSDRIDSHDHSLDQTTRVLPSLGSMETSEMSDESDEMGTNDAAAAAEEEEEEEMLPSMSQEEAESVLHQTLDNRIQELKHDLEESKKRCTQWQAAIESTASKDSLVDVRHLPGKMLSGEESSDEDDLRLGSLHAIKKLSITTTTEPARHLHLYGRLSDRIHYIQEFCERRLGLENYHVVHRMMKNQVARGESDAGELERILGENGYEVHKMMEQLLFMEDALQ